MEAQNKTKRKDNRYKIKLRPETHAALRTICNARGKTLNEIMQELIFAWVWHNGKSNEAP